ncbi:MAG: putative toxin-antitoxin system toxin component, PIN family [Oscillospiraceae bacterium]|nr:putative toxin-antitoxin system toxin component, PIN family [Oscillospiraceae bacterium]
MKSDDKIKVVIDTNVLVSALWSKHNRVTEILSLVINDALLACYDVAVMQEYQEVLSRPNLAFHFEKSRVNEIINKIKIDGLSVVVRSSSMPLKDESDRAFYDVAKACNAYLITSNIRHYPNEPFIVDPFDFIKLIIGD